MIEESLKSVDTRRLKRQFEGKGEVKGFRFTQIARNDFAVIYEKVYKNYIQTTYEVFEIKVNTRFNSESYPTSKAFGIWAWDIDTLEKAVFKFHEITKKVKERTRKHPSNTHAREK
ncbi:MULTISPECIES: hypothetical protein [unclassified Empedobacter]|uniref:hypothetical protein n=1 Tax=unclassified Empedobacter TaxID=2643773 RepID=UPI0025B899F0|nr:MULTISPECIES: hypothetical protein [unclassified Empedobacter]